MKKIKSALELALEKTKDIKMDRGDAREMDQQQYIKAAMALSRSYLQGKISKEQVKEKIERYPEEIRDKAKKAFIDELFRGIELDNTLRALEAFSVLREDEQARNVRAEIEKLYHYYLKQLKEAIKEIQENAGYFMRKKLSREGINGSALLGFNIKHLEQSEKVSARIKEEYKNILTNSLKSWMRR